MMDLVTLIVFRKKKLDIPRASYTSHLHYDSLMSNILIMLLAKLQDIMVDI
jgi:hypothetical protein